VHFTLIRKSEKNVRIQWMVDKKKKTKYSKLDKQRHGLSDNLVRLNDVVFSLHALFMTLFILFQTTIYKVITIILEVIID
jgi:hypothetical protein